MANTVNILGFANTFGDWVVATNAGSNEINSLGKGNWTKDTGTLILNGAPNGLQVANNAYIQGQLQVQGTGSSAIIQNNLIVGPTVAAPTGGGSLYLNNTVFSLYSSGQANIAGTLYATGPSTGLYVSNNATINGNTRINGIATIIGSTSITGTIGASNFSGTSSGTNTGDQTDISGTAGNITAATNSTLTTLSNLSLPTSQLSGTVGVSSGGTNLSSYTTGDILYASGATTIAKLIDVATGNVVISGGVGVAPSYGKVGLTTHVSGILPSANGGTGSASLTANNVLLGNGTSSLQVVSPGNSGNLLTSTGTTWISSAPVPQIQTIGATVATNAMTISAPSGLRLDFRDPSLASGTITTVSGTPANLVIPSGATLGTIAGKLERLILLALNISGTIELAVVNIMGGVDLTETVYISTTAISAGASSPSVIYSTTARTSVAFRVIGCIDSSQVTAGLWANTPQRIQGAGGQALTALSSLGYGQTWQNVLVSPGRNPSQNYYNTTNRPIFIEVGVQAVSGSPNITIVVNGESIVNFTFPYGTGNPLSFIVPIGATYYYTVSAGTTVNRWYELREYL
jgi:hypothetical protein